MPKRRNRNDGLFVPLNPAEWKLLMLAAHYANMTPQSYAASIIAGESSRFIRLREAEHARKAKR